MKNKLPKYLYHGSSVNDYVLMPGIKKTKELTVWENGLTNEYLYAGEEKEFAIDMAFASLLEKKYLINKFQTNENDILIELDIKSPILTKIKLSVLKVFIYTINTQPTDKWLKINKDEGSNEWRTKNTINHWIKKEMIYGYRWLKNKNITINHPRF